MRALKIRTQQGMIALTSEEATALRDHLEQVGPARAAAGTLSVSANASTSVTFTDIEKAAVLDVLVRWLEPEGAAASQGVLALKTALAHDLGRS